MTEEKIFGREELGGKRDLEGEDGGELEVGDGGELEGGEGKQLEGEDGGELEGKDGGELEGGFTTEKERERGVGITWELVEIKGNIGGAVERRDWPGKEKLILELQEDGCVGGYVERGAGEEKIGNDKA